MPLNLGDTFPDFSAETSQGSMPSFHSYIGANWAVFFSHPADFTPVCTTELGAVGKYAAEFDQRGVKLVAVSCNDVDSHKIWIKDILAESELAGEDLPFPIVADPKRELAVQLGMVDPEEKDAAGLPMTCRAVFIVGPDKKLKLSLLYPATTGRNFDEVLRVIDSLQLTANQSVATPANWQAGGDCMVLPSVSAEAAVEKFPKGVTVKEMPSGKGYMRFTPDPTEAPAPVQAEAEAPKAPTKAGIFKRMFSKKEVKAAAEPEIAAEPVAEESKPEEVEEPVATSTSTATATAWWDETK